MALAVAMLVLSSLLFVVPGGPGPGRRGLGLLSVVVFLVVASPGPVLAVGARPLGMGSAYLGISDDENALFFNVAGLSQLDRDLNQASSQVLERNDFRRDSVVHVGKIYESSDKKRVTLEEYLESDYNFKAEIERVSNYAYGAGFLHERRSLDFNQRSGEEPPTYDRRNTWLAGFATRFPIAERLTRRPELYAGLRLRYSDINRKIPSLMTSAEQNVFDVDVHMFYRANSRFHIGSTLDSVISESNHHRLGARPFSTTYSLGGAYYYGEKRDTILAADLTNIFNSRRGVKRPEVRFGAERQFLDNDFVFRIGGKDGQLTLGFGVRFWEEFRLDYAFERGRVLDEHTVSLRLVF
jgi:hypothetical protein